MNTPTHLQSDTIDRAVALQQLTREGYQCRSSGPIVLVQDPERSSIKGLVYREVTLQTNGDLRRFISARS